MPKSQSEHPKTITQDLQSLKESDLLDEPPRSPLSSLILKLIFAFGGLLTLLLLTSFIFLSYPLDHIIAGKLESHTPIANMIALDTLAISFEQDTQQQLEQIYLANQKVEFSLCLLGKLEQQTTTQKPIYHITSLYQPLMYQQTFNHVIFEPCSKDTLIMLHSHPYKSCIASDTDINTLKKTKEYNPAILMVVMCEPNRYSVYS